MKIKFYFTKGIIRISCHGENKWKNLPQIEKNRFHSSDGISASVRGLLEQMKLLNKRMCSLIQKGHLKHLNTSHQVYQKDETFENEINIASIGIRNLTENDLVQTKTVTISLENQQQL